MSVRINGGGAAYPVKSAATPKATSAKQQTQASGTGYSSASSFSGSQGATQDDINQIRSSWDNDSKQEAMRGDMFGTVSQDTKDRLIGDAKQQLDAVLNQSPPLPKDQLDAKVKDIKDQLRQKMEIESSLGKLMQDTQNKIKEDMQDVWGSPWS